MHALKEARKTRDAKAKEVKTADSQGDGADGPLAAMGPRAPWDWKVFFTSWTLQISQRQGTLWAMQRRPSPTGEVFQGISTWCFVPDIGQIAGVCFQNRSDRGVGKTHKDEGRSDVWNCVLGSNPMNCFKGTVGRLSQLLQSPTT